MRTGPGSAVMAVEARIADQFETEDAPWENWGGAKSYPVGGHHVYCPIFTPHGTKLVIDNSMDWHDRVWTVSGVLFRDNGHAINGPLAHLTNSSPPAGANQKWGWRGDTFGSGGGWDGTSALGGASKFCYLQPYDLRDSLTVDSLLWLYADSTNSWALTLRNETLSSVSGFITIFATEQSGRIATVP